MNQSWTDRTSNTNNTSNTSKTNRSTNGTDVAGEIGLGVPAAATPGGGDGGRGARDVLTELLRREAVNLLAAAVQHEVGAWIADHAGIVDEHGHRRVVRNGSVPEREIITGIGPVKVNQPRVHDRRTPEEGRETFTSAILPPYLRKTRSMEDLIPWLYLKGVSTGDFSEALTVLIGADTPGFSATTVTRLKESWEVEYKNWSTRDLTGKNYVYIWVDGIHFNIRLGEQDRQCILVILGATADGQRIPAVTGPLSQTRTSPRTTGHYAAGRGRDVDADPLPAELLGRCVLRKR